MIVCWSLQHRIKRAAPQVTLSRYESWDRTLKVNFIGGTLLVPASDLGFGAPHWCGVDLRSSSLSLTI